jgi:hypothetical protein
MSNAQSLPPENATPNPERPKCGVVMPISICDGCSEQHWSEVKAIICDSLESAGFSTNLVSDADDVGIIQKRIIQNLYDNPIVVCDVSGKNPNVMFELGMRLAFDKPTIIVKDDKTSYSFDTSPIEHLEYPRDLRFSRIVDFKRNLAEKVKATTMKAETDSSYTTFLKHFGKFSVAKLQTTEISKEDFIIEELRELRRLLARRESTAREQMAIQAEKEFLERQIRERNDSPRRRNLNVCVESQLDELIPKLLNDKPLGKKELEMMLLEQLLENKELVQMAGSRQELRDFGLASIRKFLGS